MENESTVENSIAKSMNRLKHSLVLISTGIPTIMLCVILLFRVNYPHNECDQIKRRTHIKFSSFECFIMFSAIKLGQYELKYDSVSIGLVSNCARFRYFYCN